MIIINEYTIILYYIVYIIYSLYYYNYFILFADDTNMFLTGKNLNNIISTMNEKMVKVVEWLNINRLSLNTNKTHYIIFSSRKRANS